MTSRSTTSTSKSRRTLAETSHRSSARAPSRAASTDADLAQEPPAAPLEVEALADPLYSQTTFLDPHADESARGFSGPGPAAPPLPDLLEALPEHGSDLSEEELELAEADTALDDEPTHTPDPLARPFSPDTAAALDAPSFERAAAALPAAPPARPLPEAATRLMLEEEPPSLPPFRTTPPPAATPAPMPVSARAPAPARMLAEADTVPRPHAA